MADIMTPPSIDALIRSGKQVWTDCVGGGSAVVDDGPDGPCRIDWYTSEGEPSGDWCVGWRTDGVLFAPSDGQSGDRHVRDGKPDPLARWYPVGLVDADSYTQAACVYGGIVCLGDGVDAPEPLVRSDTSRGDSWGASPASHAPGDRQMATDRIKIAHQYTIDLDPRTDIHGREATLCVEDGNYLLTITTHWGSTTYTLGEDVAIKWLVGAIRCDPNITVTYQGSLRTIVDCLPTDRWREAVGPIDEHRGAGAASEWDRYEMGAIEEELQFQS